MREAEFWISVINMPQEIEPFVKVTFAKEIEKVIKDLETKVSVIAGQSDDHKNFQFSIRKVTPTQSGAIVGIQVVPPSPRPLKDGEPLQIMIGLPDGLFLIRTKLILDRTASYSFALGDEIFKLQRRNNFRVAIPSGIKAGFNVSSYRNQPVVKGTSIPLVDLSAKGCRLNWQNLKIEIPKVEDSIAGTLSLASGRPIEVFAQVRVVLPGAVGSAQVGIEFHNLSQKDEQVLIVACMQYARALTPVV